MGLFVLLSSCILFCVYYLFDKFFFVVSSRQERPFKFLGLFIEVCFICVSPEEPVCFTYGNAFSHTLWVEGRAVDISLFVCRFSVCLYVQGVFVLF